MNDSEVPCIKSLKLETTGIAWCRSIFPGYSNECSLLAGWYSFKGQRAFVSAPFCGFTPQAVPALPSKAILLRRQARSSPEMLQ
jgi:hypothetical protein